MNKILVCPIAYNENIKLKTVIDRYLKSNIHQYTAFLIMDDASDDGTSEMIAQHDSKGIASIKHEQRQEYPQPYRPDSHLLIFHGHNACAHRYRNMALQSR